jgi:hypothetical protein
MHTNEDMLPVIPVLRRLRQEDLEFEPSLDYVMSLCLKQQPQLGKPRGTASVLLFHLCYCAKVFQEYHWGEHG